MSRTADELKQIRDQHRDWIRTQPGIKGSAISENGAQQPCLRFYSDRASDETKAKIRERFNGIPVTFEETGEIKAQ